MRTVKEPDVRRQEILDGAIRVFAEKGYDKATMATIARELNISQGLCYRYFPSKEDVYHAAIDKYADLILEEHLRSHQQEQSIRAWIEGIAGAIDQLTAAETRDERLYALFHQHSSATLHNELMLRLAARLLPHVEHALRRAMEKGEIVLEDPHGMAVIGLYGELGVFFTNDMTQEQRLRAIRTGWLRLLGLN